MELEALEAKTGYAFLHLGLCSSDIVEGARDLQVIDSLVFLAPKIEQLLELWARFAYNNANRVVQGRTHLLPATATTAGYRAATSLEGAMDSLIELVEAKYPRRGFRGAVGTEAPQAMLQVFDDDADRNWCAGQVPNRSNLYAISTLMSTVAMNMYKMAADFRIGTALGEIDWDTRGKASSSLVAKKVNPTAAERVCSLARMFPKISADIWDAGAHSYFERTLDDSAVLRIRTPEMFLLFDQMIDDFVTMLERVRILDVAADPMAGTAETDVIKWAPNMKSRREAQEIVRNANTPGTVQTGRASINTEKVVDYVQSFLKRK